METEQEHLGELGSKKRKEPSSSTPSVSERTRSRDPGWNDAKEEEGGGSDVAEGPGSLVMDTGGEEGTRRDENELLVYGLKSGGHLEVQWDVLEGTEEQDTTKTEWWSAKLGDALPLREERRGKRVWQVHYDAHGDFEPTTCKVIFYSSAVLYDLEYGSWLKWRREGDLDGGDEESEQVVLSIREYLEDMNEQFGDASKNDAAQWSSLENLPMDKQQQLAYGFRHFADTMKAKLRELIEEKGESYIVQAEDIQDILHRVKS